MRVQRLAFVYRYLQLGGVETVLKTRLAELERRAIPTCIAFLEERGGESLFPKGTGHIAVCRDDDALAAHLGTFAPTATVLIDTPEALSTVQRALPHSMLVAESHTTYPEAGGWMLESWTPSVFAGIMSPSRWLAHRIQRRMASRLPIAVVPNAVGELFTPAGHPRESRGRPILAWVGRLDRLKNWRGFVELFRRVRTRHDVEGWVLGGNGSPLTEQQALREALGTCDLEPHTRWFPEVPYNAMPDYYREIAASGGLLVCTSWSESFGMVALEAMACGCPVVAPAVGGLRELIEHGTSGLLFPPVWLDRAAHHVGNVLTDTELRQTLIAGGLQRAGCFSAARTVDAMVEALAAFEQHVVTHQPSPGPEIELSFPPQAQPTGNWERELSRVLARHPASRDVVVMPPSVYWHTSVFQRPNQMALALGRAGCLVFFCEPPVGTTLPPGFHAVAERVYVANVPLGTFCRLDNPIVLALAYHESALAQLGVVRLVYEVIDELEVLPGELAELRRAHVRLTECATLVLATSERLLHKVRLLRPDAVLSLNAADTSFIRSAVQATGRPPSDIEKLVATGRPIIGYYGSMARWLDYPLLRELAVSHPEWTFVLIGPTLDDSLPASRLEELPNVFWFGPRPYHLLPGYLRYFDVAIIPFLINEITQSVSPLKLFEYMAASKPVITTDLNECRSIPGVLVARDANDFAAKIRDGLELRHDPGFLARIEQTANDHTWDHRAVALLETLRRQDRRTPAMAGQLAQRTERLRQAMDALGAAQSAAGVAVSADESAALRESNITLSRERDALRSELLSAQQLQAVTEERVRVRADALDARTRVLAEREQELTESRAALAERDRELAETRAALAEAETRAARSALEMETLQSRLAATRQEADQLFGDLNRIYTSRLWRIASVYWRVLGKLGRIEKRSSPPLPEPHAAITTTQQLAEKPEGEVAKTAAGPSVLPVAPCARLNAFDVVCLPIIDWDFRFQRPQQLASCFADSGHRVFYVAQGMRPDGPRFELRSVRNNVWEVSLRAPARNVYTDQMDDAAREELLASLQALRVAAGIGAAVTIVDLPFWWPLAEAARRDFAWPVVYDCMDLHSGFSTNRQEMLDSEHDLLAGADLVVVSSSLLEDRASHAARRLAVVRNACDHAHFARVRPKTRPDRPLIGYYGAIADWFDSDLVADLAERRPDWDFVLVGSTFTADTRRLSRLGNVKLPGEQPYAQLPLWLETFDVLVIPFKRTPLTEATNPVKVYEMLAAGKPVVAVPIPEVAQLAPLVRLAATSREFEEQILAALAEERPELAARRRSFAAGHTWAHRYRDMAPHVDECFPLASVLVVTFGNLHLTRSCLESIFERTEWPRVEVIVVDNGSSDGTPAYLQELAARHPNLRVIANSENRGFAAANNQALQAARGEILVLLNNDTVVPRGWLSGLVRHLRRDAQIGILGPVTNSTGNEAQVEVGYSSLDDMPDWAFRYTRDHADELHRIPVLAMFCLAMTRSTFERVGMLDERFAIGMFEDDDYSLRVHEAGLGVVCAEDVFVHHSGRAAFAKLDDAVYRRLFDENKRQFEEKWGRPWVAHRYRWQQPNWEQTRWPLDSVRALEPSR